MEQLTNRKWWKAAVTRAIRTAAQTAVAIIGTGAVGMTDVNWAAVGSAAVLAATTSMLMSIGGLPEVDAVVDPDDTTDLGHHLRGE